MMRIKQILLVFAVLAFSSVLYAQGQAQPAQHQAAVPAPLTEKELTKEIKSAAPETVINDVKQRGVDFEMTPEIEKKLHKAKATDEIIAAVRQEGPKARAQMAKMNISGHAGGPTVPKEQIDAFSAIKGELDPDKIIALVDDFAKKYPDSSLLTYVYAFGADGYQQKGNLDKIIEYSDKALKLKPDNLLCLLLKLEVMPQPQYLNKHEADRDKILEESQAEAAQALKLIPQIPKQTSETDENYQKRLSQASANVHSALGMVHLDLATASLGGADKSELAKAEQEYKASVMSDHPDARDYYRLGEACSMEGKLDDALQAFTKAGQLGQGTMLQAYADQKVKDLKKLKAQTPAAPQPK
jgi:hypothetical protein